MCLFSRTKKELPMAESKPIPKKRTLEVNHFNKEEFEIGRTQVEVTFKDGKVFNTWIYGDVEQFINYGKDEELCSDGIRGKVQEPYVGKCIVHSSFHEAKFYVQNGYIRTRINDYNSVTYGVIGGGGNSKVTIVDDRKDVTESYIGEVLSRKLGKTESFKQEFNVAIVVPKKND